MLKTASFAGRGDQGTGIVSSICFFVVTLFSRTRSFDAYAGLYRAWPLGALKFEFRGITRQMSAPGWR